MKIELISVGKKFRNRWIFRGLNFSFSPGNNYVILGENGSGKSTLLQILSGVSIPSEGEVKYSFSGDTIDASKVYEKISFAAPYVQLFEQLTLNEMIDVHLKFKKLRKGLKKQDLISLMYLEDHAEKQISNFSSGMKQRLKLGLAIATDSQFLFLDEPLSNLDEKGKNWYTQMITDFTEDRSVVVCSNHTEQEYHFCDHVYNLNTTI